MDRKRLGIVVFDEVEVLDFCGPFEVFSIVRFDDDSYGEKCSPFEISLVSQFDRVVRSAGGMKVVPNVTFEKCPPLDILVVPGGLGARREMHNEAILSFVRAQASNVETLASVCTGALVLANTGLLNGLTATTHWRALQLMKDLFPKVLVDSESHVVQQGKIITSAGISAGIDMALRVVANCYGDTVARRAARYMEYPFPENNERRIVL